MTLNTNSLPESNFIINAQYIKDLSFEVPSGAASFFFEGDVEPNVSFNLSAQGIEQDIYEVCLSLKVELNVGEKIVYIAEVDYRGVFTISGVSDSEELKQILLIRCAELLYPYARAVIAQIITASSFSVPNMNHLDFKSLYQANKETMQ